jgi:predicted naringenin-chalcone synthase
MTLAHINRIGTATPPHDVHVPFMSFMRPALPEGKARSLFDRMAARAGIMHRYSVLHESGMVEAEDPRDGFYRRGAPPATAARMKAYETHAPNLAESAISALNLTDNERDSITHLILASCTGFVAPGLDQILARRLGLRPDLQRTVVGFMGCAAAVPALRLAQAAVLADPEARVLVINLELCTLHLQETDQLDIALSFLLFGDGCTAALITADPVGFALHDFRAVFIPQTEDLITWHIGNEGFIMHLSGQVPGKIAEALKENPDFVLRNEGTQNIDLWAVHGGGKSILDAVQGGLGLPETALATSRAILNAFGNMSSATVMFVLSKMLGTATSGERGMAMAFGPGMVAETFRFQAA